MKIFKDSEIDLFLPRYVAMQQYLTKPNLSSIEMCAQPSTGKGGRPERPIECFTQIRVPKPQQEYAQAQPDGAQ